MLISRSTSLAQYAPPQLDLPSWQTVKMGGGGYCTGGDMHPDGTMITRVDVNSLYIGNVTLGAPWVNAWNADSLPATITGNPFYGSGCWEARIAPSNSSIIYAIFGSQYNTATTTLKL